MKVRRKAPLPEPVPGKPLTRANLASHYGAESKDLDAVEKALNSFGLTTLSKNAAAQHGEARRRCKQDGARLSRSICCASSTTTSSIAAASARSRSPRNWRKSSPASSGWITAR